MPEALTRRAYLFGAAGAAALSAQSSGRKPNILLILSEDMGPHLSCYGEPLIQTPNLDRFAREGALCKRAFTTAPVCSASRSALATGMYQTAIGSHNHRTVHKKPLPAGVRHISEYLREAGYFTVLSGPGPGRRPTGGGTGALGSGKTDYNFTIEKPFDSNDWKDRPAGKPFFAQLTIQESHKGVGWPIGRKETPNIDQSKLKLPPYFPDHPIARDEYANYLEATQLVDRYFGEVMARLEQEGIADNTLVFFMGDNGQCLFRSKQFLYDGGIHVPLLVLWPGKVLQGSVREDMISGIDVTAAILAAAGVQAPKNMHGRDFLAKDAKPREHIFAARDRCDIATERMRCVRDARYKYIRNYLPAIPYMQANPYKEKEYPTWNLVKQLYREGKLNAVQSLFPGESKPIEELFDLQADPYEVKNLAADPAHRDRLTAMRKLLDGWLAEVGDKGETMENPLDIYGSYFKKV